VKRSCGCTAPIVPSFSLYGEPPRDIGHHFLHLEPIDDRSRPADWNIRPHAHDNLSHVFFVSAGAGEMRTDSGMFAFDAPSLLIVPARAIHAFTWEPGTAGRVLTISDSYLGEVLARGREFGELFAAPDRLALRSADDDATRIADDLEGLGHELAWTAPAHATAVEAQLLGLLVKILRIARRADSRGYPSPGRHAELVAQYREAVEEGFRTSHRVADYAAGLGVSLPRLRAACLKSASRTPLQLLGDRVVLEAKRLMLYSNMTVNEAGYFLGFDDPAYFSRVFRRHTGLSPRAFRTRNAARREGAKRNLSALPSP
jgi:AraC family transcriptional activator of pobA